MTLPLTIADGVTMGSSYSSLSLPSKKGTPGSELAIARRFARVSKSLAIAPTLIIATTVGNLPDGGQLRFPSLHLRLLFSSDINCTENLIPILVIPQQCILVFGFTIVCCQTRQWHIHIVWILFPVRELFRTHPPIFLGHSPSFYFG